jgi:hypothetical protein
MRAATPFFPVTIRACGLAMAFIASCIPPAAGQGTVTFGELTSLSSDSEGMLSNRFQKHSWFTSDGRFHVAIRAQEAKPSLQLLRARDESLVSFDRQYDFQDSGTSSTSDGVLINGHLFLVYDTASDAIAFVDLEYSPEAGSWELRRSSIIYRDEKKVFTPVRPTIGVEPGGRMWAGCVLESGGSFSLKSGFAVFFSDDGGASWLPSDAGLPPPIATQERSLRLIAGEGAVYALYSDRRAFGVSVRPNDGDGTSGWNHRGLFFNPRKVDPEMVDRHGAHFSATVDASGDLHFASNAGDYRGVYLRYNWRGDIWSPVRAFDSVGARMRAGYMQIATDGIGRLLLVFSARKNQTSCAVAFESLDNGDTWTESGLLTMQWRAKTGNARLEMPELLSAAHPILQQVTSANDRNQGAVRYIVRGAGDAE